MPGPGPGAGLNGLRESLEDGEAVFGANAATGSPTVVEVYGRTDLDFVWVDLEHAGPSPFDSPALHEFTRAADATGIDILARVPEAHPKMIGKVLDAGVTSVLVPQVETAEEVERAVSAARFRHRDGPGGRGAPLARCTGWDTPSRAFLEGADEQVLVGAMIETAAAVENLEEILSVPGLGFVFVGFSDLSVASGHPGEQGHDEVQALGETVRAAAGRADVPVGRIAGSAADAADAVADGYRIVQVGYDLSFVRRAVEDRLDAITQLR